MKLNKQKVQYSMMQSCKSINSITEETGLSRSTVTRAIQGHNNMRFRTLGLIAKSLNTPIEELLQHNKTSSEKELTEDEKMWLRIQDTK